MRFKIGDQVLVKVSDWWERGEVSKILPHAHAEDGYRLCVTLRPGSVWKQSPWTGIRHVDAVTLLGELA